MPKEYTHADCFDAYGVIPRNPRWSWSGRSADGNHVAVTLWQDRFEDGGRVYTSWPEDRPGEWKSRPGFIELVENLAFARDRLDGKVNVILATARDRNARPRSILRCFPQPNLKMRVVQLDEHQGTFRLERVEPEARP